MGAGKGQNRRIQMIIKGRPQMLGFEPLRNHSGDPYLNKSSRAIWVGEGRENDPDLGKEVVIDLAITLSASQGGMTVYNGHMLKEGFFMEKSRDNLYVSGDKHIDPVLLTQALLSNIKQKVKQRCPTIPSKADNPITYTPKIESQAEIASLEKENFRNLREKNILVPKGVPCFSLNDSMQEIKITNHATEPVVETVIFGKSPDAPFGYDPLVVCAWGKYQKIAVPVDMILLLEPLTKTPLQTSTNFNEDELIF